RFKRRPDIFFALNLNGLEVRLFDLREKLDHAAAVIARTQRLDLAVAKQVRNLSQLRSGFERCGIVGFEVIAVRTMKRIDVPQSRMVSLIDDFQGFEIAGRNKRSAGFVCVKEFLLVDLVRLRTVRNENEHDLLLARPEKSIEEQKDAPRQ